MNDIAPAFLDCPDALDDVTLSPIQDIIEDIRAGKMVVLMDEEDRENEGDLVIAAEFVTADHINFMAMHGRGLICLTLTEHRCKQLNLSRMVPRNGTKLGTNFTASIEAAEGVTTGISTADRAHTIRVAVKEGATPQDIVSPGHVFPLMAQEGGVLIRAGHTEAGCDLAMLAGLAPAAVICEILNEDGTMARLPDLRLFAMQHDLKIGTIADLIHYRSQTEKLVECVAERTLHTPHGEFNLLAYRDKISQEVHLALVKGYPDASRETLVRVHEPLSPLDFMEEESQAHAWSIPQAMRYIHQAGEGVIVMLRRDEEPSQLIDRVKSEKAFASSQHTLRDYGIGAQILRDIGVGKMHLMATPRKIPNMTGFGLEVTQHILSSN
jgi:3,4-dihydroxy 2-butanone 4-phosphate synthase/GTP cyclohydrolase II